MQVEGVNHPPPLEMVLPEKMGFLWSLRSKAVHQEAQHEVAQGIAAGDVANLENLMLR